MDAQMASAVANSSAYLRRSLFMYVCRVYCVCIKFLFIVLFAISIDWGVVAFVTQHVEEFFLRCSRSD